MMLAPGIRVTAALAGYAAAVLLVQDAGAAALDTIWSVVLTASTTVNEALGRLLTAIVGTLADPQRIVDVTLSAVMAVLGLLGVATLLLASSTLGTGEWRTADVADDATVVPLPQHAGPEAPQQRVA